MTTCQVCGEPLTLPFIWAGRSRSMQEGPYHCAVPHLCSPPSEPPLPDEWEKVATVDAYSPFRDPPPKPVPAKAPHASPVRKGYRADADL
jgi:hypothetical protein